MATPTRTTIQKRSNGATGGLKFLIATLSVMATIGGWAGFSLGAATASAATNTQVTTSTNTQNISGTQSTTNLPSVSLPSISQSQPLPFTSTRSSR